MRSNPRRILYLFLLLALFAVVAPGVAYAQQTEEPVLETQPDILAPGENSAQDDAELQEEPAGFAYAIKTGELALALDSAAVFCPASGAIVVHPGYVQETLETFGGVDNGDGTWTIPDPDTGDPVVAEAELASAVFDDGRGGADAAELRSLASLKVVPRSDVVLAPWFWPRCWRLRLHYRCGVTGTCPLNGQCIYGYFFSQRRKFLQCTFAPFNLCLEFLYPVCTVTRYTCRDCTGPVIFRRPLNRFVCAVF